MKKTTSLMLMMIFVSLSSVYGFKQSHEIRFLESLRGQEKSRTAIDPQLQKDAQELLQLRQQRTLLLKSANIRHLSKSLTDLQTRERALLVNYGLRSQNLSQPIVRAKAIDQEKKQRFLQLKRDYQKPNLAKAPQDGVLKHRLDSIVMEVKSDIEWQRADKQSFTYDYNGRVNTQQGYTVVEGSQNWVGEYRMTTEYNNQGMPLDMHYELWDQDLEVWYTEFREQTSYDELGRPITMKSYYSIFDEVSNSYLLYGEQFMEVSYGADGEINGLIMNIWDEDSMEFVPHMKVELLFENGKEMMLASWVWNVDSGQWMGEWKFEYVPIADTPLMDYYQFSWDTITNNWYIVSKEEFSVSNDEFGIVIALTEYEWDYSKESLQPSYKSVYSKPYAAGLIEEMNFGLVESYYWNDNESSKSPTDTSNSDYSSHTILSKSVPIMWIADTKTTNTFDSQGRVVISNTQAWTWSTALDANQWVDRHREESTYDSNGDMVEMLIHEWYFNWDTNSNELTIKNKTTYAYNTDHLPTVITFSDWDFQLETWYYRNKNEFSYNEQGQITQMIGYSQYNETLQEWVPYQKYIYGYDYAGENSMTGYYNWNANIGDWQLDSKSEYLEDEEGRLLLDTYVYWSSNLNSELVSYREEHTYNERGQMTLDLWFSSHEAYDGQNYFLSAYGYKWVMIYDSNGYLTEAQGHEYENGEYVLNEKTEIFYSSTHPGAVDYDLTYEWDNESSSLKQTRKTVGVYNYDITRNQMIVPFDESAMDAYRYFEYMPISATDYRCAAEISDWLESSRTLVYFTQAEFSTVDTPSADGQLLYPNPVRDQLQVKLPNGVQQAELLLFDAQGRLISRAQLTASQTVDLANLNAGLYLYRLITDKGMFNGKLIKE